MAEKRMTKGEIFNKVSSMITEMFHPTEEDEITPYEIKPESKLHNDLGIDSLDLTEFFMEIDKEFNINTDGADVDTFLSIETVDGVGNLIHKMI